MDLFSNYSDLKGIIKGNTNVDVQEYNSMFALFLMCADICNI